MRNTLEKEENRIYQAISSLREEHKTKLGNLPFDKVPKLIELTINRLEKKLDALAKEERENSLQLKECYERIEILERHVRGICKLKSDASITHLTTNR